MRRMMAILLACCWVAFPGPLRAGIYDPEKPKLDVPGAALEFELFRDRWAAQIVIADPARNTAARKAALAELAALQQLTQPSAMDLVRRGILHLRLQDAGAAQNDLQQAKVLDPRSFWAMTALGTAYQQSDQISEAFNYLSPARDLMPAAWPVAAEQAAVRRVEATQLALARARFREQATRPGRGHPLEVDALFDVRFVGASGEYEAGSIAPAEKAKLPADAIATVQQLLFWLPGDTRLYWLLGELYNANGDLDSAYAVFDECINARRLDAPTLRKHRLVLSEAIQARNAAAAAAAASSWMPNAMQWWIAGALIVPFVGLLIYFQLRELRRRMRGSRK